MKIVSMPTIRGSRVSRDGGKRIGQFTLDNETISMLGEDSVGVFIGSSPKLRRLAKILISLDEGGGEGIIVVVPITREIASDLKGHLEDPDDPFPESVSAPKWWRSNRVAFAIPEALSTLKSNIRKMGEKVSAIFIVDPNCSLHQGNGFRSGSYSDQPKHIHKFRDAFECGSWRPPIAFFVNKPAISCNTRLLLGPYGLEALWFVDGALIRAA